ncbi:MAG: VacJ family lipoprotein [Pseudomonadota bacterium]
MRFLHILFTLTLLSPLASAQSEAPNPDPFEGLNRQLFAFNDGLDRYFLRPVAKGYDFVTPDPIQRGVGNMFANMYDFNATINSALQWRWDGVGSSGGRFLVNSTIGILGFFDVATRMGIRPNRADFGQTLAVWGLDSGPYLMVPLFGPRTLRSGTGTIVDTYTSIPTYLESVPLRNTLWGLELVDGRARLLNADELISGDRYIFVRDAYLQQREFFVNGGVVEDDFSDFAEDDWDEDF